MKVLSLLEAEMVSGGADVCVNPNIPDQYAGVANRAVNEVTDFFVGLNRMGSDLGIWLYNMTHNC